MCTHADPPTGCAMGKDVESSASLTCCRHHHDHTGGLDISNNNNNNNNNGHHHHDDYPVIVGGGDDEMAEEEEIIIMDIHGPSHKTTEGQSFLHLLKGYVGPGCLSLPWAITQLGIIPGCIACIVMSAWTSYNCWTIVELKRQLEFEQQQQQQQNQQNQQNQHQSQSYERSNTGEISESSCESNSNEAETDDNTTSHNQEDGERSELTVRSSSNNNTENISSSSNRNSNNHHHHNLQLSGLPQNRMITYPVLSAWLCGHEMERFTSACVCIQQLAVCTVFLSFVGANLQAVMESTLGIPISHVAVITLAMPAALGLTIGMPDLKSLAPVTLVGTTLLMIGLGLLAALVAIEWPNRPSSNNNNEEGQEDPIASGHWSVVPLALCAILYSYEGICLVLPVENSMIRPKNFSPVFVTAMSLAALIFCVVASFAYAAFGPIDNGSITAFLLEKYMGGTNNNSEFKLSIVFLANAAVSLSVLVTYPLQLYPCTELLAPWLDAHLSKLTTAPWFVNTSNYWQHHSASPRDRGGVFVSLEEAETTTTHQVENEQSSSVCSPDYLQRVRDGHEDDNNVDGIHIVGSNAGGESNMTKGRIALVLLTYLAAIAIPNVEALISLAGALAGSSVSLLIPPVLQITYNKHKIRKLFLQQRPDEMMNLNNAFEDNGTESFLYIDTIKSVILFAAGFLFMMIGTTASVFDIYKIYKAGA